MKVAGAFLAGISFLAFPGFFCVADSTAKPYHVVQMYGVPGDGGWDYVGIDVQERRLYVSHGNEMEVLDADSGRLAGRILDTPGVHGAAIADELHRGFTSNGADSTVTIFDTRTLATIAKVSLRNGTDAILYDPFTKRIFPLDERATVLDAQSGNVVGTLDLGGDTEAGVSDGKGTLYINLADKAAIAVVVVDAKALSVVKTYPIDRCTSPHSLAYDAPNQRLFVGCRDGFAVLDATSGKVVGRSLICSGVDSGAFDVEDKLIFESCVEGVISVIRQVSPDYYELVDTVKTELYAKTMVLDPKTKKLFLPTAEFETVPNTDPKSPYPFRRQMKSGSFHVLVVARD